MAYSCQRCQQQCETFAGDAGKLYSFNAVTSALDDVSKAGGYTMAAKDYWQFVQFGNYIVAVGGLNVATQILAWH